MSKPGTLAHRVDYRRLATQRQGIDGSVALVHLPRIAAEMAGAPDAGPGKANTVDVELAFHEDGQRRVYVGGRIRATLTLTCQRCLRTYEEPMDVAVAGVVVGDDEAAARVPRAHEPVLAEGDILDVHALVSDELLLALPSVARCHREDCVSRYQRGSQASEAGIERRQDNPFAVLSQLKRDR